MSNANDFRLEDLVLGDLLVLHVSVGDPRPCLRVFLGRNGPDEYMAWYADRNQIGKLAHAGMYKLLWSERRG